MKKIGLIFFFFILTLNSQAQQWALRVSANKLDSYCKITNTDIRNNKGETSFLPVYDDRTIRRRYWVHYLNSSFADISVAYSIKRNTLSLGYRSLHPPISVTIVKNGQEGFARKQYQSIPAIKLNYSYTMFQSKNLNGSHIAIFSGLLLCFRGYDGSFDNEKNSSSTGYLDSSGNFIATETTLLETKGIWRPLPPTPYLNLGIDAGLRLGKRFKLGVELAAYTGYTSLYIKKFSGYVKGKDIDSEFTFDVKLKPYFFSGGIYFQYMIK